jgi:transposase-like protein
MTFSDSSPSPAAVASPTPTDLATLTQCPLCHSPSFHKQDKTLLGIFTLRSWMCDSCGAAFKNHRSAMYRLASMTNRTVPVWQNYGSQTLTSGE